MRPVIQSVLFTVKVHGQPIFWGWVLRLCRYCKKRLSKDLGPRALHCDGSHKSLAYRARLALSEWRSRFSAQEAQLVQCAPVSAAAYRLGHRLKDTGRLRFVPSIGGFALGPFEVPAVPISGVYVVEYLDSLGQSLGTPIALQTGLYVEAAPKQPKHRR